MSSLVAMAVAVASHVRLHGLQASRLEGGQHFSDRCMPRHIDLNVRGLQLVERPHADPTDYHPIDLLALERLKGHACAMIVVLVIVGYGTAVPSFDIHDHEGRRRSKMRANRAFDVVVGLDWNTDVHGGFFSCFSLVIVQGVATTALYLNRTALDEVLPPLFDPLLTLD
jgi:hypothetical protein